MNDITEQYKEFTEWYFNQMDIRSPIDNDKDWIVVDCAMQIFGQGKNGGLALYCGGDLKCLSTELSVFKTLGLKGFEDALTMTIANGDESAFDDYFFAHYDELFLAGYNHAVNSGLYKI